MSAASAAGLAAAGMWLSWACAETSCCSAPGRHKPTWPAFGRRGDERSERTYTTSSTESALTPPRCRPGSLLVIWRRWVIYLEL